jgi:hypothetical protein
MLFLTKRMDGGPESNVTGYWLIEIKSLFSIVLLRFSRGSREAYHNHAFHAISWILKGELLEMPLVGISKFLRPSLLPVITTKSRFHKVYGMDKDTWAISFRGPWDNKWKEFIKDKFITLTHGRKIL